MTTPPPSRIEGERELARPVEECFAALRHNVGFLQPLWKLGEADREAYGRHVIKTVFAELQRHGWIDLSGVLAIHAEESASGLPRSSVLTSGGGK